VRKSAVRGDTRVLARATGVVGVPFIEIERTGGAGLGGEFRVDLHMLGMRCKVTFFFFFSGGSGVSTKQPFYLLSHLWYDF
jgi:hypothetical protein